jgi:hypothetical protein
MNWRLSCGPYPYQERFSQISALSGRHIGQPNLNVAAAGLESLVSRFIHIVMPGPSGREAVDIQNGSPSKPSATKARQFIGRMRRKLK